MSVRGSDLLLEFDRARRATVSSALVTLRYSPTMDMGQDIMINMRDMPKVDNLLVLVDVNAANTVHVYNKSSGPSTNMADFDMVNSLFAPDHLANLQKMYTVVQYTLVEPVIVSGPVAVWLRSRTIEPIPIQQSDTRMEFTDMTRDQLSMVLKSVLTTVPMTNPDISLVTVLAQDPFSRINLCRQTVLPSALAADVHIIAIETELFHDLSDTTCRNIKGIVHSMVSADNAFRDISDVRHYRLVVTRDLPPNPGSPLTPEASPIVYMYIPNVPNIPNIPNVPNVPNIPNVQLSSVPSVSRVFDESVYRKTFLLIALIVAIIVITAALISLYAKKNKN